ncbi:MAG: signal recognition particle receptor subunit alpha, partial [Acidimicrobiia bacterium]
MFDTLTSRLNGVFDKLRSRGRLDEKAIDETLREVRMALLEADVAVSVAKTLLGRVKERALDAEVRKSLTPGQQVIKIVHEELVTTLGGSASELVKPKTPPLVILMVGLQGSGKTTTAAK